MADKIIAQSRQTKLRLVAPSGDDPMFRIEGLINGKPYESGTGCRHKVAALIWKSFYEQFYRAFSAPVRMEPVVQPAGREALEAGAEAIHMQVASLTKVIEHLAKQHGDKQLSQRAEALLACCRDFYKATDGLGLDYTRGVMQRLGRR